MTQPAVAPVETVQAADVPQVTLELLTGKKDGVQRSGGIFTKEDFINLKLYVKKGLSLPPNIADLKDIIGYDTAGIAGLEPPEIKVVFDAVRSHCLGWDHVESEVIQQSISVTLASKQIVETGDNLLDVIDQWPFYDRVKKLGDVADKELEGIRFEPGDNEAKVALGTYLETLKQIIDAQLTKTTAVTNLVSDYRIVLVGGKLLNKTEVRGLEPMVKQKYDLMIKNNLAKKIKDDEEEMTIKQSRIEQLKKDYSKYVGLAFSGAIGGVIGLAITGGIFGDKAEKARKEKNKLIGEVRALRDKVKGEKGLQKAIENLSDDFNDIGIRMLDAETALQHLEFMWKSMLALITESQTQWNNIDNGKAILAFVGTFKLVIGPWREVGNLAGTLMDVWKDAQEEYKRKWGDAS